MRKTISFVLAVVMFLGSAYALHFLLVEAAVYRLWMPAAAGVGVFVASYWLWEDFIKPSHGSTRF
jgi:integral membrane sensor domain MASE1